MSKCFLLGAGASLGYRNSYSSEQSRPPGSNEFFKKGREAHVFDDSLFPGLEETIQQYVAGRGDPSAQELYDIEDIMSYAADNSEEHHYGQLSYYIYSLFRYYSRIYRSDRIDNYQKLASYYRKENYTTISLNYDILFEQALYSRGLQPEYSLKAGRHEVPIAKIHGSINIVNHIPSFIQFGHEFSQKVDAMYGSNVLHTSVVEDDRVTEVSEITHLSPEDVINQSCQDLVSNERTGHLQLVLVPPIGKDKLNNERLHRELARMKTCAEGMLRDASELVIVGSEIRETDNDLRELLETNFDGDRITLVVGENSRGVRERIQRHFPDKEVCDTRMRFGPYVDSL